MARARPKKGLRVAAKSAPPAAKRTHVGAAGSRPPARAQSLEAVAKMLAAEQREAAEGDEDEDEEEDGEDDNDDVDSLLDERGDGQQEDFDAFDEDDPKAKGLNTDYSYGKGFMMYRQPKTGVVSADGAAVWKRSKGGNGTLLDSRAHRYDREVGYDRGDSVDEEADARMAAARELMRGDTGSKGKAHRQRVQRWARFERYVLERHPHHEYAVFLRALDVEGSSVPRARQVDAPRMQWQVPNSNPNLQPYPYPNPNPNLYPKS
jgi:hypothetical protein